jgi:hypothetical protein
MTPTFAIATPVPIIDTAPQAACPVSTPAFSGATGKTDPATRYESFRPCL